MKSSKIKNDILAKCLATENISIEYSDNAVTASFDTETRIMKLPIWIDIDDVVRDLFILHEIGHALYTDIRTEAEAYLKFSSICKNIAVAKSYFSIVEDARCERLIKDKYKGSRKDFNEGYKKLIEMDFFGIDNIDEMTLTDRINIHFKTRSSFPDFVKFTNEEMNFVDMVEKTNTTDDSIVVAKKLFEYELKKMQDEEMQKKNLVSESESAQNETVDENLAETPEEFFQRNAEYQIPKTVENIYTNMTKMLGGHVKIYDCPNRLNYPILSYKDMFQFLNDMPNYSQSVSKFYEENLNTVNVMIQNFLMKKAADELMKRKSSKTGILNLNKLSQYKITENVFKTVTTIKKGKSHGFVIFGDWSSSMQNNIDEVVEQIFLMVIFCRKMNIPFDVYLFTDNPYILKQLSKKTFAKSELIPYNNV